MEDRSGTKRVLKTFLEGRQEIILCYLFGSYLQKTRDFRDIDIAVYADPGFLPALNRELPYGYTVFLNSELVHLLGYQFIDLTLLNRAPPLLVREVIRSGELVFCRSEEDRVRFEVHALKRYADTEHLRRIKREYMRDRIQEGMGAYE